MHSWYSLVPRLSPQKQGECMGMRLLTFSGLISAWASFTCYNVCMYPSSSCEGWSIVAQCSQPKPGALLGLVFSDCYSCTKQ